MATFRTHTQSLEQDMQMLAKQHPMMRVLYSHIGAKSIDIHDDLWKGLIYIIMGQQLSNKAFAKIVSKVPDELIASPQILKRAIEQQWCEVIVPCLQELHQEPIQKASMALPFSQSKLSSMLKLCDKFICNVLNEDILRSMSTEQRHVALGSIKGIGPWSLQMMDIFIFNEKDVFASGDLEVIQALYALEGKERKPKASKKEQESFIAPYSKLFSPYGTCATAYMWHFNSLPEQEQASIKAEYKQLKGG